MQHKLKVATQYDVARMTGVSQRTVSRCFIQPDGVSGATRERVYEAAGKLGYRLNSAARSIRRGRSEFVMLLRDAGMPHHYLHTALLDSIHQRLGDCRLSLVLGKLPGEHEHEGRFPQAYSDGALVFAHSALSEEAERHAQNLSVPVVWLNTLAAVDAVCPDDLRAGQDVTDHLIRLGHRRIAFLDQRRAEAPLQARYCNAAARREGYRRAMDAAGLEPTVLHLDATENEAGLVSACTAIFGRPHRPTGLVICRKRDAQALVFAASVWFGMRIPRDLSVVTFVDGTPSATPSVTACMVPWHAMGLAAVDMLVQKIENPDMTATPSLLPMEWHSGETTANPPRAGLN